MGLVDVSSDKQAHVLRVKSTNDSIALGIELKAAVRAALAEGSGNIIISLDGVTMITSTDLGTLIGASRAVNEKKGRLILCSLHKSVIELLKMTHLDRTFEVVEDEKAAKALVK